MASVISALTSGGGGISMTGDASGILNLNSNGTNVVAVSSTGVAVTGTLSSSGAVTASTTLAVTGASTFTGTGKFATTIGVGNATPSASGSGITFPATQSPSSDANTLDDYEEGTWTPVITPGAGSITSYTSSGTYTKVGRTVMCTITFNVITNGTGSGGCALSGLPFVFANGYSAIWRRGGVDGAFCILSNSNFFNSSNGYPLANSVNDSFAFIYQI